MPFSLAVVRASSARNGSLYSDRAASPPKFEKSKVTEKATGKSVAKLPENDPMRPEYKDPFLAEDARTTARLKGICRGC